MHQLIERIAQPPAGITASEFARRAGVNRSTLHRIASGAVEPSLATLRELAIAHGLDVSVTLTPLSDPDAAIAARHLLDDSVESEPTSPGVRDWMARLQRLVPELSDPVEIVSVAGRASSLLQRRDAVFLRGESSGLRLASAGTASDAPWAVSGRAAIDYGRERGSRGPSVLWTDDPARAASVLSDTHEVVGSPLNAHVVVVRANPTIFIDTLAAGPVRYVAPIQMLLDCIGLGGDLEQEAEQIATGWSQ